MNKCDKPTIAYAEQCNVNKSFPLRMLSFVIALVLLPGSLNAHHDLIPDPPPRTTEKRLPADLDIDPASVTVSGLSSGAFFAHQFHVAHSSLVAGAGFVAGGPFACVETIPNPIMPWIKLDATSAAVVACTRYYGRRFWGFTPAPPAVDQVLSLIAEAARRNVIDDPGNLASSRVWMFRGSLDTVIPPAVARALENLYGALGVKGANLRIGQEVAGRPANHGMPVEHFHGESRFPHRACSERAAPYIIECGFDAAGLVLEHLYPDGFRTEPADPHAAGSIAPFDQTEFFDFAWHNVGLSGAGYIYVPHICRRARCRLHVAFHGCRQNADAQSAERVHDDFIRDAGYNRWAAANGFVVLYPQTTQTAANRNACWDFWGYSGPHYRDRRAPQIRAVYAMITRLMGKR